MREWEEEQTKLDRDWYMTGEEGAVVSAYLIGFASLLILGRWERKSIIPLPSGKTSKSSSKLKLLQNKWFVQSPLFIQYYLTIYAEENICEASPICMLTFSPLSLHF